MSQGALPEGSLLPCIGLFHRLRLRSVVGKLRPEERDLMEGIRELFEPQRQGRRVPLVVPVRRRAVLLDGRRQMAATARFLSLREVEIESDEPAPRGALRIAIAGHRGRRWYRFGARIARVEPQYRTTLRLGVFLGTTAQSRGV